MGAIVWIAAGVLLHQTRQGWVARVFHSCTLGMLKMYFVSVGVLPLPYPGAEELAKTMTQCAIFGTVAGNGFLISPIVR